jgi:hypothetical protein
METFFSLPGELKERRDALDREDLLHQVRQQHRLVA